MKLMLAAAMLYSSAALAQTGWACSGGGLVQKYARVGDFLEAVDDPFTKLMDSDAKSLGQPIEHERWRVVLDNEIGIVAIGASAVPTTATHGREVYGDTLLIDKSGGGFRHIGAAVGLTPAGPA
jgi:hypothetical protein